MNMKYPAENYRKSDRPYRGIGELDYPFHDRTITVTQCGRICFSRYKINLSTVFAGQNVGIKQVADKIWLVSFMEYDLGYFDHEAGSLSSAENPFAPKVLPMSPGSTSRGLVTGARNRHYLAVVTALEIGSRPPIDAPG